MANNEVTIYAVTTYDYGVLDAVVVPRDEAAAYAAAHPIVLGWEVRWMGAMEVNYCSPTPII